MQVPIPCDSLLGSRRAIRAVSYTRHPPASTCFLMAVPQRAGNQRTDVQSRRADGGRIFTHIYFHAVTRTPRRRHGGTEPRGSTSAASQLGCLDNSSWANGETDPFRRAFFVPSRSVPSPTGREHGSDVEIEAKLNILDHRDANHMSPDQATESITPAGIRRSSLRCHHPVGHGLRVSGTANARPNANPSGQPRRADEGRTHSLAFDA